jgi:uroporphyrinogen decarboxylase
MEQVLMDMAMDDPAGLRIFERKSSIQAGILERALDAADGGIDLVWLGEDLGTQHCPLISLEMFRKHIRPRHQRFVDIAKAYNVPVMIHCCGSSSWAFEDFIAMGINVVDTLQPEAANMSPVYLKNNFGQRLAFHGSISTAGPMAYGSVQEAVANVKETLEIMMPGGGYIMAPTHMIQDNTPTQNVIAVYEAVRKYGVY